MHKVALRQYKSFVVQAACTSSVMKSFEEIGFFVRDVLWGSCQEPQLLRMLGRPSQYSPGQIRHEPMPGHTRRNHHRT